MTSLVQSKIKKNEHVGFQIKDSHAYTLNLWINGVWRCVIQKLYSIESCWIGKMGEKNVWFESFRLHTCIVRWENVYWKFCCVKLPVLCIKFIRIFFFFFCFYYWVFPFLCVSFLTLVFRWYSFRSKWKYRSLFRNMAFDLKHRFTNIFFSALLHWIQSWWQYWMHSNIGTVDRPLVVF